MRACVVAVLLLSCSKREPKPTPQHAVNTQPTSDAAASPDDCAKRAERLERELRDLAASTPGFLPFVPGINTPSASGGKPVNERGWVIAVARDGSMSVRGSRLENIEDARNYTESVFRSALEKFSMNGGSARDLKVPIYIWADREAPARVIAELEAFANPEGPWPPRSGAAKAATSDKPPPPPPDDPPPPMEKDAKAEREQVIEQARKGGILGNDKESTKREPRVPMRLLVASGGHETPAQRSGVAAKLPASEPESTRALVEQLRSANGTCPAIVTTFGASSLEALPAKEAEKLAKDIPGGLVSCACKLTDMNSFEAGMRTWFDAWASPLGWIEIPKLAKNDSRTIGQVLRP